MLAPPRRVAGPRATPEPTHLEPTTNQILTVTATFAPTVQTLGGTLGLDFNVTPGDDELVVQSASGISNIVGSLNLAASGEATTNRLFKVDRAGWASRLTPAGVGGCRPSVCGVVG